MKLTKSRLPSLKTRPAKTILVQAGTIAFRVDLTLGSEGFKGKEIARVDIQTKSEEVDLLLVDTSKASTFETDWITTLLKQKPSPAKRVKILSTETQCAVLEVPLLNDYNTEDAIALEAEAFFNIPIADAQWAWMRLPAEDGLVKGWASLIPIEKLMAWRNAVSEVRGAQLEAVGHPCGIRLAKEIPQAEIWPGLVLLNALASERREIFGWSGKNALSEAVNDPNTQHFFEDPELSLVYNGGEVEALRPALSIDLSDAVQRAQWIEALATMIDPLESKLAALPIIRLPKKPMSNQFIATLSGGAAAGMALLLGLHFMLSTTAIRELESEIETLSEPKDQLEKLKKEEQTLKRELRKLQSKYNKQKEIVVVDLEDQRVRMRSLLKGLAEAAGSGIVLIQIQPDGFAILIEGAASTAEGTLEYNTLINEILGKDGWVAKVKKREAQLVRPGGGPWLFELLLSPIIPEARGAVTAAETRRTAR